MGNASEASQSEFITALRAIRDRLNESSNAGPINVIYFRDDNIQVNVEEQSRIVLRGRKTRGTDAIPTYRAAPTNFLTAATDRGRPKALDYSRWTPTMAGVEDTSAPILPVYVEPNPYRLQLDFTGLTHYDWFSPDEIA